MRGTSAGAGPWLRLTALGGVAGVTAVVVSGGAYVPHRVLALLVVPPLVAVALAALLAHRSLVAPSLAAVGLFHAALASWWSQPLHVGLAAASLAAAAVSCVQTLRLSGSEPLSRSPWRDYVTLTKPRIMSLLLLTGGAGMFVGAGGVPPLGRLGAMLLGLALACGGASALNHVLDRDIDRLMGKRTERRPVAAGRVPPSRALEFGLALSALSFVLLTALVNPLTAALALVGNLFYVLVYTRWLKRWTPQNIVIGGAAGAVPPLVGYAAATGDLTLTALFLFAVVFVWTPPHFWALALLIRREYEAARVPMLPVVRGERATTRQILGYTAALVALTLVPVFGWLYLGAAAVLGAGFLWLAWRLATRATPRLAALTFHYSLAYLALLFVAMALDPIV